MTDQTKQPEMSNRTHNVLLAVARERERQNAKWGEQNHPNGTSESFAPEALVRQRACERAFANDYGTWFHILDEEVWEAYAESDPEKLRAELIQVAAVVVAWIEAIDRREHD